MRIEGELTLHDLKAFAKKLYTRRLGKRRSWLPGARNPWAVTVMAGSIALVVTAVRWLMPGFDELSSTLALVMDVFVIVIWTLIAMAVAAFFVMFSLVPRWMAKQPGVLGHRVITLDDEGLREQTVTMDQKVKWAGIRELDTTDEHVLVFIASDTAYVIPRRFFSSVEEAERFIAEVGQRLASAPSSTNAPVFVGPE